MSILRGVGEDDVDDHGRKQAAKASAVKATKFRDADTAFDDSARLRRRDEIAREATVVVGVHMEKRWQRWHLVESVMAPGGAAGRS